MATSNKALVAKHGAELLSIAEENNINFLFEASVGGGIPIIRPLNSSLTADEIEEITGILNGTTNYMLTKMSTKALTTIRCSKRRRPTAMQSAIRRRMWKDMMPAGRLRSCPP